MTGGMEGGMEGGVRGGMTGTGPLRPGTCSALVVGAARDCGAGAERTLAALQRAGAGLARLRWLIVESDSRDDTAARLSALADGETGRLVSLGDLRGRMPSRTQRIAHARNTALEELRAPRYADVGLVIVADLDGVNEAVTRGALETALACPLPWSALTANQDGPYYDVWALRHPVWSPDDCWRAAQALTPLFGAERAEAMAVRARQARLRPSADPVEVDSAFGGLGLYRREAFLSGRYRGEAADGGEICEHVPFHADLRAAGGRIFIHPRLLNTAPTAHLGGPRPLHRRLVSRLRQALR